MACCERAEKAELEISKEESKECVLALFDLFCKTSDKITHSDIKWLVSKLEWELNMETGAKELARKSRRGK